MEFKKFLTVFAVFDKETQKRMEFYQSKILSLGYTWTQTNNIPFHISLGSFPTSKKAELKQRIADVCSKNFEFEIDLTKICDFDGKVLFIEPELNKNLLDLHNLFEGNFADGFPWHAHSTVVIGEKEAVCEAKKLLGQIFEPFKARVTGIQLGEFFPAKMILTKQLRKVKLVGQN